MKQNEIRSQLIDGTIRVIARDGLDKASAKQIESETGINVVYIYRCFRDKEDMFAQVFLGLDHELIDQILTALPVMELPSLSVEKRCRLLFEAIWRFLLGNSEKCLCYIRYYHSRYFQEYSSKAHQAAYRPIVAKFSEMFLEEANVWMLLNHILNVMLDFAVKVFHGDVPNDEDTSEHVFRLIYYSIRPYFKNQASSSETTTDL